MTEPGAVLMGRAELERAYMTPLLGRVVPPARR